MKIKYRISMHPQKGIPLGVAINIGNGWLDYASMFNGKLKRCLSSSYKYNQCIVRSIKESYKDSDEETVMSFLVEPKNINPKLKVGVKYTTRVQQKFEIIRENKVDFFVKNSSGVVSFILKATLSNWTRKCSVRICPE